MTSTSVSATAFLRKDTNPKFALALIVGLLTCRVYDTETNELIGLDLQELGYDDILDGEIKLDTEVNVQYRASRYWLSQASSTPSFG